MTVTTSNGARATFWIRRQAAVTGRHVELLRP